MRITKQSLLLAPLFLAVSAGGAGQKVETFKTFTPADVVISRDVSLADDNE
jgi:hypothetical protein